jgi:hypothetical protein
MRQLAGLFVLMAVIGAAIAMRPSTEHRLAGPEAGADGRTEAAPAPASTRDPPVASQEALRVTATTASPRRDEAVGSSAVGEPSSRSSGDRDASSVPSAPSSQAPSSDRYGMTPPSPLTSSKPADADARRALTKDLQRELRRVGCYQGDLDGSWGPETKRAMSAFTDRVNATLPVEEPDYILLALVRGQAGQTCGKSCPSGQELASDGRCLPRVIIARHGMKGVDKGEQRSIAAGQQPWPLRGAALVAGSRREVMGAWRAAVKPNASEGQSGSPAEQPPLAGRMAVGAAMAGHGGGAAASATSTDTDATAEGRLASPTDRPSPEAGAKHERSRSAHRGAVAEQHRTVASRTRTRLAAAKGDRSAERPRKARISVARAPPRASRAASPAYRSARRNASRRALAAWWRRWRYAVYSGMAPTW